MSEKNTQESQKSEIILESSLQAFFYDQLTEVNKKYASPLPQETIYYSSLVMDHFGVAKKYFELNEEGKVRDKTLGVKLLESTKLTKTTQKNTLKDVGDTALLLCGYFSDSVNKKIVDLSYYQDIGQIAYQRLDSFVPAAYEVPSFFKKLSDKFSSLAEVINIVSKKNQANSDDPDDAYLLYVANDTRIKAS